MATSHQMSFLSELAAGHSGPTIPLEKRAYFQARLRNQLFDYVLTKFEYEKARGLTKAALARRIGKTPDIVSRWLGAPGNWTLDTVSDLLLGIAAEELEISSSSVLNRQPRNYRHAGNIGASDSGRIFEEQVKHTSQPPRPQAKLKSEDQKDGLKSPQALALRCN